jgi:tetratricopeptide (TPR) repeat protein
VQSADQLATALLDPAWQVRSGERHGSLRSLADWSYQLLEPLEQALFRRVGVFAGWFDAEDVAAIEPAAGMPIPVLLGALVEHSMLVQEQTSRGARYRLLEILRTFALEQLEDAGELEAARLSHADRMVWLGERIDMVPRQGLALRAKAVSITDDIRAAIGKLLEVDPRRAAWLCAAMRLTWIWGGRAAEGLHWSELALAANPDPSPERCWNLYLQASVLAELGRQEEARAWFARAEDLAGLPEYAALRTTFLITRALILDQLDCGEAAYRLRLEAIQAFSLEGNEWSLARALNHTAMSLLFMDRPVEAREFAERGVEVRRRVDPTTLFYVLDTQAQVHAFLGELDLAKQCWLEAAEQCRDKGWGSEGPLYPSLFGLALVAGRRGKTQVALRLHYCAERLMTDLNGSYNEPISPQEAELFASLEGAAGPETVARLRAEGEALTPEMAVLLAESEA